MRLVTAAAGILLLLFACLNPTVDAAAAHHRPKWFELEGYTFDKYIKDFGRRYKRGTVEYQYRELIFKEKLEIIQRHNRDPTQSWKRGVNAFTDMTPQEWSRFNRYRKSSHRRHTLLSGNSSEGAPLPFEVDYRTWTSPRVLTSVKHQGSCGNCWAHSTVQSMESFFALLTGRLPVLSTQQVTACTPFSAGCDGGDENEGFWYVNGTYHGLTEEWAYPFTDFFSTGSTSACLNVTQMYPNKTPYTWFAELTRVGIDNVINVNSNDAQSTMTALAHRGPLSISVAAGNWQDYETGVFQNSNASGSTNEWQIDHAVQLVGYGRDKQLGKDYWIVRNSWSTNWGEDGYIRLDRSAVEPCSPVEFGPVCGTSGVLNEPSYPVVKELPPTAF